MSAAREVKEERQREREFQREQQFLTQAFNQQGELDRGWMRDILDTEDLEEYLPEATIKKIQAMINKEWVLANLTNAEAHDRRHKLEVIKIKILGTHPPEESAIVGPVRAFLFDNEREDLMPLTPAQRNTIDQIITTLQNRVTRGRGGFERKQINTNIARTESEASQPEDSSGRFRGLFG